MQIENVIDYLLNEAGLTRDEIMEAIARDIQKSFGNNPNQEVAH